MLGMADSNHHPHLPMKNHNGSSTSALAGVLVVLGVIGGLALMGWLTIVMLDLKHLNTSGFTLP